LAHETAQLLLQYGQVFREFVELVDAYDTDLAVFECDGVRYMDIVDQPVHADDFAGQQEAGDLHLAGGVFELCLQGAGADAVDGFGRVSQLEQGGALWNAYAFLNELV